MFKEAKWINPPKEWNIEEDQVCFTTDPVTDFWQKTYYGFCHDNAPALLVDIQQNFTFTVRARFDYSQRFDQCGLVIYVDQNNWFKASLEYENENFSRLGSVVTNLGYSDWATTDIPNTNELWYRLSRRGPDLLLEYSKDGRYFIQMRIFHLHVLGETTQEMGISDPPIEAANSLPIGLYACSPLESRFQVRFDEFSLVPCSWGAHSE